MAAPEGKKSNYAYFAGHTDSGLVPEQISSPAEAEVTVMEGASAWNSGGTWEEKSVFQKTEAFLKHELEGAEMGPGLRVDAVESVKGEASVVYVRKKKKPGFELDLTLKWTYAPDGDALPPLPSSGGSGKESSGDSDDDDDDNDDNSNNNSNNDDAPGADSFVTGTLKLVEIAEHSRDEDDIRSATTIKIKKRGRHPKSLDKDIRAAIMSSSTGHFESLFAQLLEFLHSES